MASFPSQLLNNRCLVGVPKHANTEVISNQVRDCPNLIGRTRQIYQIGVDIMVDPNP